VEKISTVKYVTYAVELRCLKNINNNLGFPRFKSWPLIISHHGKFKACLVRNTSVFHQKSRWLNIGQVLFFCVFVERDFNKNAEKEERNQHQVMYTAISRKVVGWSARDKPERFCGWFWVLCSLKKFERMAGEAVDIIMSLSAKGKQQK